MWLFLAKIAETLAITVGAFALVKSIEYLEHKYQTGWFTVIIAISFGVIYVAM